MEARDQAALELAIEQLRKEQGRAEQLDWKIEHDGWQDAAEFAAYCRQSRTLCLRPWEIPPCWVIDPDSPPDFGEGESAGRNYDGRAQAARLLREMLALGISRTPIRAPPSQKRNARPSGPRRRRRHSRVDGCRTAWSSKSVRPRRGALPPSCAFSDGLARRPPASLAVRFGVKLFRPSHGWLRPACRRTDGARSLRFDLVIAAHTSCRHSR